MTIIRQWVVDLTNAEAASRHRVDKSGSTVAMAANTISTTMLPTQPKKLRSDAAENAERVLAAAIRAGLGEGKNVPLAQIAADAGVGVGTLYRRYPNRAALMEALEVRAYRLLIAEAEDALARGESGIDSIERFLRQSFVHRDQLVLPLHGAPRTEGTESARLREQMKETMGAIIDRGHRDGTLRPEVTGRTVVRFGAMLTQPMSNVRGWADSAAEQRSVFLRGISTGVSL
ncbi:MAG: regulatory protein TetR [Glaciihabitans sp.]|nr:regulatory protein TetR [Glaciihabitans sp.]